MKALAFADIALPRPFTPAMTVNGPTRKVSSLKLLKFDIFRPLIVIWAPPKACGSRAAARCR